MEEYPVYHHFKNSPRTIPDEYRRKGQVVVTPNEWVFKHNGIQFKRFCIKHERRFTECVPCGGGSTCVHNKKRVQCSKCGGGSMCVHNVARATCKACDGNYICPHNKRRNLCVDCNGAGICDHNKERAGCKLCEGSNLCKAHLRKKSHCKDCGGVSICEHNVVRSYCIPCNGSTICDHKRIRTRCVDCGGSGTCEHRSLKADCKECKGSAICVHDIHRYFCKVCDGKGLCEHDTFRSLCKKCHGGGICHHDKSRYLCADCGGNGICIANKDTGCGAVANPKYGKYCARCYITMFPSEDFSIYYRYKEAAVVNFVRKSLLEYSMIFNSRVPGGKSRRRPDIFIDFDTHVVIIEIDEYQHIGYSSENKRMTEIMADVGLRPLVFIRFNPDSFIDDNGKRVAGCWKKGISGPPFIVPTESEQWNERLQCLKYTLECFMEQVPVKDVDVVHLFFTKDKLPLLLE